MRPGGKKVLGYFPMPMSLLPALMKHIRVKVEPRHQSYAGSYSYNYNRSASVEPDYPGAILDPCAGEGTFLKALAAKLGMTPYAIEIESQRAALAREAIGENTTFHCSFEQVHVVGEFNVIFCNPPYDSVGGLRVEPRFLERCLRMLSRTGLLIGIVPETLWRGRALEQLNNALRSGGAATVEAFRFPEPEYQQFKQVVLFAQKTQAGMEYFNSNEPPIKGVLGVDVPEPIRSYGSTWYKTPEVVVYGWKSLPKIEIDHSIRAEQDSYLERPDVQWEFLTPLLGSLDIAAVDFQPLMPLKPIHAAQVASAGVLNNTVLGGRYVVAGRDFKTKIEIERTNKDTGVKVKVETDKLVTEFCEIDLKEKKLSMVSSEQPAFDDYIVERAVGMVEHIHHAYPPITNENTVSKWAAKLARIHAPAALHGHQNGLLDAQLPIAAALLEGAKTKKTLLLCGEMGVGKTVVSLAVMANLAMCLPEGMRNIIILCPAKDDLIAKWGEEIHASLREFKPTVHVVKRIHEVQDAFKSSGDGLNVILVRETAAKTASGWQNVVPRRTERDVIHFKVGNYPRGTDGQITSEYRLRDMADCLQTAEIYGKHSKKTFEIKKRHDEVVLILKTEVYYCDRCMQTLEEKQRPEFNKKGKCPHCKAPLWTSLPRKGTPEGISFRDWAAQVDTWKPGTGLNVASPRKPGQGADYPIAKYIRDHYSGRYVLIIDESHMTRGSDTAIGYASADLLFGAWKALQMTGTLYGGLASQLFPTLWRTLPWFREQYSLGDVQKFIDAYGLMETITTFVPSYRGNTISGYREFGGKPSEIPGVSPALATLLLPNTAYLTIEDLGIEMPSYAEHKLFVELPDRFGNTSEWLRDVAKEAMRRIEDDRNGTLLAKYRAARRTVWDAPHLYDDLDGDYFEALTPYEDPPSGVWPKEEALLRLIWQEKQASRKVLVALDQINRRDCSGRLERLMSEHGMKGTTLRAKVKDRTGFLKASLKDGCDAVFTTAELLDVGINLTMFCTIAWYGLEFDTITVSQFNRRIWRMTQDLDCNIYYLGYQGTPQAEGWTRVAKKLAAMQALQGMRRAGLSRLLGDVNLVDQLADVIMGEIEHQETDLHLDDLPTLPIRFSMSEPTPPSILLPEPPSIIVPAEPEWTWEPVVVTKKGKGKSIEVVQFGFAF